MMGGLAAVCPAITIAAVRGIGGGIVVMPFGLLRVSFLSADAVKWFCLLQRYVGERFNEGEVLQIRGLPIEVKSFITDSVAFAAFHGVAIVIEHLTKWAIVDDGLVALEAWALFAFPCLDGNRTELDTFNRLPGGVIAIEYFNTVESGIGKGLKESLFGVGTTDTTAPEVGVVLEVWRNSLIGNNIRNHSPSALF